MRLVALMGASSGTVHTTLCKLLEQGIEVDELVVVATQLSVANEARWILQYCPCPSTGRPPWRPGLRVRVELLEFSDVRSIDDLEALRRRLSALLDSSTILDVTGGRKAMAIAAALEGYRRGATVVSTIIPQGEYDRIRRATKPCEKVASSALLIVL